MNSYIIPPISGIPPIPPIPPIPGGIPPSAPGGGPADLRSEEHTSELQSQLHLLCPLFFLKDTATTEIYPLSLHDAPPISAFHPYRPFHPFQAAFPLQLQVVVRLI